MANVNNNVWELGEKYSPIEYVNSIRSPFAQDKTSDTRALTKVCQEMSNSYDDVIDEQNEYLLEIENINAEIETLRKDFETEIKNKEKEIEKTLAKSDNRPLTEEEKAKVESLYGDINGLTAEINGSIETKDTEMKSNSKKASNASSKENIARSYGNTTLNLGLELAETKYTMFYSLRERKEVGIKAVKVADELLSKVDDSRAIDKEITKKSKVSKYFLSC